MDLVLPVTLFLFYLESLAKFVQKDLRNLVQVHLVYLPMIQLLQKIQRTLSNNQQTLPICMEFSNTQ